MTECERWAAGVFCACVSTISRCPYRADRGREVPAEFYRWARRKIRGQQVNASVGEGSKTDGAMPPGERLLAMFCACEGDFPSELILAVL
jgi:hypothetical protein